MDHFYQSIAGNCTFEALYAEWVANAPTDKRSTFVEVGVWKGRSAAYMAVEIINSGKPIEFYCVDMWDQATHIRNAFPHPYEPAKWIEFNENLKPVWDHILPLCLASTEAANMFADKSCDIVFIDADHSYDAVKADIKAWLPKVKPGGILAGHDWSGEYQGVVQAVVEAFGDKIELPEHTLCWVKRV